MDIKINSTLQKTLDELSRKSATGAQATLEDFKEMLDDAIDTVNNLQRNADRLTQKLATGELKDLHQVMIAVEEVNVALQLTMQIRNKIVEAYQEVMRMQV
ncbi:MAG: flagellar hook-basal body complex protein FliE [Clostridia bacterium]